MGKRQDYFGAVLESVLGKKLPKDKEPDFKNSNLTGEIRRVYESLGGILMDYPTLKQHWKPDFTFENFLVELDEERHFNRYRLLTLDSILYDSIIHFDVNNYKAYCIQHENDCLTAASWKKNWENSSTKKHFGISDPEGCFKEKGSSRWKQRAFYDFLKDVSVLITDFPVVRFSIWESDDNGSLLDQLIRCEEKSNVVQHIEKRLKAYI